MLNYLHNYPGVEYLVWMGKKDIKLTLSPQDRSDVNHLFDKLMTNFCGASSIGDLLAMVESDLGSSEDARFSILQLVAKHLVDLKEGMGAGGKFFLKV